MKKLLAIILIVLLLTVSACGAPKEGSGGSAQFKVGYVVAGPDDYYNVSAEVVKLAGAERGWEVTILNSEYTPELEISNVEDLIAKGVDGILVLAANMESAQTATQKANAAGIPIVFIDFRLHPFKNTVPSMQILGKVLGQEAKAAEFASFYNRRMNHIKGILASHSDLSRPKVYMEMIRGNVPPGSPGKGNLGEFIEFVGGTNIGTILPGEVGTLNMEYVISEQPDIYIATGIAVPGEDGLVIGHSIYSFQTQQSLKNLASRSVVSPLNAIQQGKVYGMWHLFYDSPLNIAAVEALAKWTHPELFGNLNPHGVLKEINERFLAFPLKGVFFAELK